MKESGFWGGIAVSVIILILLNVLSGHDHDSAHSDSMSNHHSEADATHAHSMESADDHSAAVQSEEEPKEDEAPDKMAMLRSQFQEGSWEWNVLNFIESDEPSVKIVLEKVPFDGDELPSEAVVELDHLADIHAAFPFLMMEVQAHSPKAKNEIGRKAKRVACKARALWVREKLKARGIPKESLTSAGMADDDLLPEIPADDKSQKRITATLTKGANF